MYLRAQSRGHHTLDRLEERDVERGCSQRSALRGRGNWRPPSIRRTLEPFQGQDIRGDANRREGGWTTPDRKPLHSILSSFWEKLSWFGSILRIAFVNDNIPPVRMRNSIVVQTFRGFAAVQIRCILRPGISSYDETRQSPARRKTNNSNSVDEFLTAELWIIMCPAKPHVVFLDG